MRFLIKYLIILILITSCELKESDNKIIDYVEEKKTEIVKKIKKEKKIENKNIFYHIGDPYFIEGTKYIPEENYNYKKTGLASFYGKELHNVKTINNDINKVTELLGRHKTLPIPSTVKVTNLENGLSIIIKINDRHDDNITLIQVSRKVAQLLKFYKSKIAKVRVEIISDASKQMKVVSQSMNEPDFNQTIESAPTEFVEITDLNEINEPSDNDIPFSEQPIELGLEEITDKKLFIKIYDFASYEDAEKIINLINFDYNYTIESSIEKYNIIFGPLKNEDVNNLVSSFYSKGYKKSEIIIK